RAEHVHADLGADVELILDGGPCTVGIESTIVDLTGHSPSLLRPGGVTQEALEKVLGRKVLVGGTDSPRVPGLLPSHYAPRAGVVLARRHKLREQALRLLGEGKRVAVLSHSPQAVPKGACHLPLPEEPKEMARCLYARLREADGQGVEVIVVETPAEEGLGLA